MQQSKRDQTRTPTPLLHQTTLPRDQFVIKTFAQFTSMTTLTNLTTVNILTDQKKMIVKFALFTLSCCVCLLA